jgi:hypothetical protein
LRDFENEKKNGIFWLRQRTYIFPFFQKNDALESETERDVN